MTSTESYPVPFTVHRRPPRFDFVNIGSESVRGFTMTVTGRGAPRISRPVSLSPGESTGLRLVGREIERDVAVIVRWLRPDGSEYLWRVTF